MDEWLLNVVAWFWLVRETEQVVPIRSRIPVGGAECLLRDGLRFGRRRPALRRRLAHGLSLHRSGLKPLARGLISAELIVQDQSVFIGHPRPGSALPCRVRHRRRRRRRTHHAARRGSSPPLRAPHGPALRRLRARSPKAVAGSLRGWCVFSPALVS